MKKVPEFEEDEDFLFVVSIFINRKKKKKKKMRKRGEKLGSVQVREKRSCRASGVRLVASHS